VADSGHAAGSLSVRDFDDIPGSAASRLVFTSFRPAFVTLVLPRSSVRSCYQWQKTSFWRSERAFANEGGEPLVHFKPEVAFFKQAAEGKVEPGAAALADLPLLRVLGWYLILLLSEDAAEAAAVVVALS
jgi:hypothetical protein